MKEKLLELKARGEEITKEMQVAHAEFLAKITIITNEINALGFKHAIQQDGSIFIYKDVRESYGTVFDPNAPKVPPVITECSEKTCCTVGDC